ncbi:MAG: hypothetical protein AAF363_21780 [Bacteroidota bacterium]
MIEGIGRRFLPWQLAKTLKQNQPPRENIDFQIAKEIGILFSSESNAKTELIEKFAESLRSQGKKVHMMAFVDKNSDIPSGGLDFFSYKDISLLGSLKNEKAIQFAKKDFDFLFCFDQHPSILIEQVLAMSKAHFRVGYYQSEEKRDFFELMVKLPKKSGDHGMIREMEYFTKYLIKK